MASTLILEQIIEKFKEHKIDGVSLIQFQRLGLESSGDILKRVLDIQAFGVRSRLAFELDRLMSIQSPPVNDDSDWEFTLNPIKLIWKIAKLLARLTWIVLELVGVFLVLFYFFRLFGVPGFATLDEIFHQVSVGAGTLSEKIEQQEQPRQNVLLSILWRIFTLLITSFLGFPVLYAASMIWTVATVVVRSFRSWIATGLLIFLLYAVMPPALWAWFTFALWRLGDLGLIYYLMRFVKRALWMR